MCIRDRTWIPFRAPNTDVLLGVMNGLAGMGGTSLMDVSSMLAVLAMIATVSWHICLRERSLEYVLGARSVAWQLAAISSCLLALFLVSGGDQRAFIYFQF